jgi:hypothetical protein
MAGDDRSNLFSQHNEIASPPSAAGNDKCDIFEVAKRIEACPELYGEPVESLVEGSAGLHRTVFRTVAF